MRLSKEAVEEFIRLYKEQFGEELEYDVAYDKALKLVTLVEHVYKPIPRDKAKEFEALKPRDSAHS